MYKQVFITLFLSLGLLFQAYSQYFPIDTGALNRAYRELIKSPTSRERQMAFFDAFPSTWMEYIMTYQYIPDKKYDLTMCCSLLEHHIQAFENKLLQIPDSTYCSKLIQLSIGGKIDADAPTALQEAAIHYALKKPQVVFAQLSKLKRGEQLRFWLFCWHSWHKKGKKAEMEQLKSRMSTSWPKEVKIMEVGFEFSWGEAHFPPEEDYPHIYEKRHQIINK
jgi:uncharacterized protein YfeS